MKLLPYGKQTIDKKDIKAVIAALTSPYLTQGPAIESFENALSEFTGAKYTVVVSNGTAALHTAYFSLGLTKDDEVIVPALTFAATSNAVLYVGAKPVFVDVDPATALIDVNQIEKKITKKTKAIAVVDYAGQPVEFNKIRSIAKKHNVKLVDDACHALGATYHGKRLGGGLTADVTLLSFHPVKHIATGEGGAIQTNDKTIYERALMFRTHGITKDPKKFEFENTGPWYHEMQYLGFNYRLTDIQATLGISQLKKIDLFLKKRRAIAEKYTKAFAGNPYFDTPPYIANTEHAYHLYPIRLNDVLVPLKSELVFRLHKKGIGTQVHYIPVYWHPYYRKLGYKLGTCPAAEEFYTRELSIPLFPALTAPEIKFVTHTILSTCKELVHEKNVHT